MNPIYARRIGNGGGIVEKNVRGESLSFGDYLEKIVKVRNNLFHGSKVLNDKIRDLTLLNESIALLKLIADNDLDYAKYL